MPSLRLIVHELPATLRLALPIVAGHVGQMLMGWADTVMIGRAGTLPLAACAFGNNVVTVFAITGIGLLTAVSVRVSHAFGAKNPSGTVRALRGGLGLALAAGCLAALALHALLPALDHLRQAPGVVREATPYILLVGWSLVPMFLSITARNYCEAQSRPWPPFWIMLGGVLLNVALNWVLIFGKLGAPALGLTGAALATLLARLATAAGMFAYVWAGRLRPVRIVRSLRDDLAEQAALLRLGIPAGLQLLGEVGAFAAASILMGMLGVVPLAAHQIAITCAATTFMIPLGIAIATTVRVGQAVGATEPWRLRPIASGSWAVATIIMGTTATLFLLGGHAIAGFFVRDPQVVALAAALLAVAGVFQLADGAQVVGSGALRGLRDVRFPMVTIFIAYWLLALPLGSFLAFRAGLGAVGMWIGLACGLTGAAMGLVTRFWRLTREAKAPA